MRSTQTALRQQLYDVADIAESFLSKLKLQDGESQEKARTKKYNQVHWNK